MNILVINSGSSSLKFQLIETGTEQILAKGCCERIGSKEGEMVYQKHGQAKETAPCGCPDHKAAIGKVLEVLSDTERGVIQGLEEIDAIGHRVVHGGEYFSTGVIVTDEVKAAIEECIPLAPLHNRANLTGIEVCQELMPGIPNVAVFDTAFHQTMPERAYLYGLPYHLYRDYKVRRYGFHGTSHSYVSKRAAEFLGKDINDLKLIVCHLGNGASVSAISKGKSMDTSMGFSPLEGLIMGTRSGDVDPAVIEYLADKTQMSIGELLEMLNKKSGVLGLSDGLSSDFRDLEKAEQEGNEAARRARRSFVYRTLKYIGSYAAVMNGVDAIIFTAGMGENRSRIRKLICRNLTFLGAYLDVEQNLRTGEERVISTADSSVKLLVIPTNEELAICRETAELLSEAT